MEIILQKDPEGNGYSPLRGADPDCIYVEDNTWSGLIYHPNETAERNDMEEEEWKKKNGIN